MDDVTHFESFYNEYVKKHPKTPKWQIEDAYDAEYVGHRVDDPDRWRFLKKEGNLNENIPILY